MVIVHTKWAVAVVITAATLAAPAWAAVTSVSFGSPTSLTVSDGPRAVAVGDVNGDGRPDLLTANGNADSVTVRLGSGSGGFGSSVTRTVGDDPRAIALGDVNRDGRLDLVTANNNADTVSLSLGNGNGTFATATSRAVGDGPRSVSVTDLNGDGKLDLATANFNADSVSVLVGNGDGTFATATSHAVGNDPSSVVVGDVNADGKPDLVTADTSADSVSLLLGNGNGTFATATSQAVGDGPLSGSAGDLNADGKIDLVTANYGANTVSVLLGDGDGTFGTTASHRVGNGPQAVAIGDLNDDFKPDIIAPNLFSDTVTVLLGRGDGTFLDAASFAVGDGPSWVGVGDFNGDNRADLVTANFPADTVSVLLNTTPPAFVSGPAASIAGTAQGGSMLTAEAGSPDPAPDSFRYRWAADGSVITNATGSTLFLGNELIGKRIRVTVTAVKAGYADSSDTSPETPAVVAGEFTQGPTATIVGTAQVGETLAAETGSAAPTPDSFKFQWFADGVAIDGAVAKTLELTSGQEGKRVKVTVTAEKAGYTSSASTSPDSDAVVPGEISVGSPPAINRPPSVGVTSTATTGTWTPAPSEFGYQWLANGAVISGASGSNYMPTSDMYGKRISVRVTASRPGYAPASATSAESTPVTSTAIAISAFDPMNGYFYPYLQDGNRDVQTGKFRFNRLAAYRVQVINASGAEVRRSSGATDTRGQWSWNGRKNDGKLTPPGAYRFKVTAVADGKSATRTSGIFYLKPGPVALSVQILSGYILPVVKDGNRDYQEVRVRFSTTAAYRIQVINKSGSVVYQTAGYKDAGRTWYWAGRTNSGARVPLSDYRIRVTGTAGGQTVTKTSPAFAVKSGYTWVLASRLSRGGDAGTPSTSGPCYITREAGEAGYYDEYAYYDPMYEWDPYYGGWVGGWRGAWVDGTYGSAEIDCWGGTGVMSYNFQIPSAAGKFSIAMAGEWSGADLCCNGSVTKSGERRSSTVYRVSVKVTGTRAWIINGVTLNSYSKKYY